MKTIIGQTVGYKTPNSGTWWSKAAKMGRDLARTTALWREGRHGFWEAAGQEDPKSQAEVIRLSEDEVLSLPGRGRPARIQVQEGVLWLTETPAKGDVFLRAGDHFTATHRPGLVVQAMAGTTMFVWQ